jgi:hypothetical protein
MENFFREIFQALHHSSLMVVRENVIGGHVQLTSRDPCGFKSMISLSITTSNWLVKLLELTVGAMELLKTFFLDGKFLQGKLPGTSSHFVNGS